MEVDSDMKNRFPDFICNVVKQLCELRTIVNEDIQSSTLDTNTYANKLRDYISRLKSFINKVDTDFTKNYEKYSKDLETSNIVKSKNKTTKQNEDTDKSRQHSPKPVENGSSTDKEDEPTDYHSKSNNNDLENHIEESENLTKTTTKSKKDIKENNVENVEESIKETVEKSNNATSTTENSQNDKESSNSDVSNVENSIQSSTTEDGNNSEKVKIKEEVKNSETNSDKQIEEEKPKIGLIKLIDISKLLDPKIKQQTKQVDDSVILLTSSESEDDKPLTILKTNKKQETLKTYSRKNIEPRVNDKTEDQCNKIEEETNERKNLRTRTRKEPVKKLIFEKYRKIRSTRLGKKILDSSSSGSESGSDSSNQSEVSHITNTSKRKTVKFALDPNYDYKNDPKFSMKCCVKVDRIAADEMLNRHLKQMEEKQIERLTNMKALKRSRKLSKSDSNSSSSSDSDVKPTKKRTKVDKDDGKKGDLPSDSDTDDKIETPMEVCNEIIEKQTDLADQAAEALEKSSDDEAPKQDEASTDDDDDNDEKKNKNKLKDKEEKPEKQSSDDDEKQSKEEEKENKEKENSVKSDAEDKQDENKDKKDDEEKHSSDSDFQKKDKKKWRNDKLLKEKLDATDSEEELIIFRNKKNKLENEIRSGTEEEIKLPKKRSNRKAMKRVKQRAKFDSSSSSDESNKKEENYKDEKKSSSSSSSSSDSEEEKMGKKKKTVRKRIKNLKDSEESSSNEAKKEDDEDGSTRKKIRNVWTRDSLAETTRKAAKEEEERKKRIAERQKLYNEIYDTNLAENAKVEKLVLDFNEETKEELLSVHPDLVSKLKPHQANGIRFMWNACFESLERSKATGGSGCILAHCMGLGKTLQVITLIHTLLTNTDKTNIRTAMVVCPLSTVLNWISEFKKWLDDLDGPQVNVFDLVSYRQNHERLYQMQDWMKMGGVMILGYDMFRNLSNPKGKRMSKKLVNGFAKCLLEPGPDLVICDEGHLLKNEKTGISIAMNKLKTKRRIVLTGTPLQNNLKEYFCMVQFVKPNLLGTYKEYLNRFVNPITNGQYTDSTPHDISIMRKRAHVLHKMLDAVVERRDYNVLAPFLPPKHEYVLFVTLTPVQCELYKEYLSRFARNQSVKGTSYIFQDFQELQRICIHPRVLLDKSNQDKLRKEVEDDEEELQNFINDDESEKSSSVSSSSGSDSDQSDKIISKSKRRTRANPGNLSEEEVLETNPSRDEWWSKFCTGDELDNICHSSKLVLLFDILAQCEAIGDKVLLFSQSLYSLNLIEYFLERIDEATSSGQPTDKLGNHTGSWVLGLDYFRMDGSSSCDNRAAWCKSFNDENNTRARLFLISTRAGGLGINLVAANRVIIFDVSWNPSYDIQSIYRVYRFGQTKPCYIYRFVTLGTMENKIYERQVTKQAISKRVIDEQQIDRHYNQNDLSELYVFKPVPEEERPTPLVPKDRLFANLLQSHEKQIFKYHEHNSLLEDKADEGLNEEERRAAWEEFENEKKQPTFNLMQTMVKNGMYETLRIIVQQDNSTWTPAQINNILPSIVQRMSEQVAKGDFSMYRRIEEKHEARVLEQRKMQYLYQQYIQQMRAPANANYMAFDPTKFNQYLKSVTSAPNILGQFASSSGGMFTQGAAPPPMPTVVSDVVELND